MKTAAKLLALLPLLCLAAPARSQWEVFAEKPPAPGAWARYALERRRADGRVERTEVEVAVTGAESRDGAALVWLEIHPTKWLGSKQKGALKFLIPAQMSREQASQLMRNASEIVFQEPGRKAYFMTPKDVATNARRAGLEQSASLSPAGDEAVTVPAGRFVCRKENFSGRMVIDPPLVSKRTTTLAGAAWLKDDSPFRVVKLAWRETAVKGSEAETEEKSLVLLASGAGGAKTRAPERGEPFSIWKLLRR